MGLYVGLILLSAFVGACSSSPESGPSSLVAQGTGGASGSSGGTLDSGGVVGTGGLSTGGLGGGGVSTGGLGGGGVSTGGLGTGGATTGGMQPEPTGGAGAWSSVVVEPADEAAFIYDQNALRTYELIIAPGDLAALDADPAAEVYVSAKVKFDGVEYGPVGVRYKGSYGAFLAPCTWGFGGGGGPKVGKCSVKVSFNEYDPEGRFFGLKKLQFHSMNHDDSLMRDRLAYTMFRQNGVPGPRSVHARLLINGELEGIFALVEAVDGRFTRSRFTEGGKGNLYKEIWPMHSAPSAYLNALKTNEDENPDVTAFPEFASHAMAGDLDSSTYLQWDSIMRFMAVDRVIINDDGPMHFWCFVAGQGNNPGGIGNHNYYWYQEMDTSHFWLIPWDMDNSLSSGGIVQIPYDWRSTQPCTCTNNNRPPSCDPFIQEMIARDDAFEVAVDAFLAGPFAAANVDALLDQWEAQISDAVAEASTSGGAPSASDWQSSLRSLRSLISSARTNRGTAY